MNKNMFSGWKDVMAFSYVQTMKSRAMKITLVVLCLICICIFPVYSLIKANTSTESETKIQKVYLYGNDVDMMKKFSGGYSGIYQDIETEILEETEAQEKKNTLKDSEKADYILIHCIYDENPESVDYGLELNLIYGQKSDITEKDADTFAQYLSENSQEFLFRGSSVGETEIKNLLKEENYSIYSVDRDGNTTKYDAALSQTEYTVTYFYLMVILFAVILAGSKVAELLVTEKSSRVMEYLLTNIRPLALLVGKVISATLAVFTILAALAVSLGISLGINTAVSGHGMDATFSDALSVFAGDHLILGMIISVVVILTGFLFYGFIAGIAGATVSKVEELSEGLKLFSFAVIIGAYLVIAFMMFANVGETFGTFDYFIYYFPLSSMFIVPVYLLMGKISLQTGLISLLILAASTVLIWFFASKVFETVLYHNGNTVKLKELIEIYKSKKKNAQEPEVRNEK